MARNNTQRIDYMLIYLILFLMVVGLVVVYSIESITKDSSLIMIPKNHALYTQLATIGISIVIGGIVFVLTSLQFWYRLSFIFLIICMIALLMLDLGFGVEVNGAKRWFSLHIMGMQVQPAEFSKLFIALFLIAIVNSPNIKNHNWFKKWFSSTSENLGKFILMLIATILTGILVYKTIDLGSTVIIVGIFVTVILCSNHFNFTTKALLTFICISSMGLLIHYYKSDDSTGSYRQQRLELASKNPTGFGFQATQAEKAWTSSHFFNGTGLGNSKYRMTIPAYSSDYILAGVAEHFGFIPMFAVIMIYIAIIFRSFSISHQLNQCEREKDRRQFSSMVCMVLPTIILMEVGIHFFTSLGLFPSKGLTLPFVSSGGSSMLMCTISMALIVRVNYETFYNASTTDLNDKFYDYDYDPKTTI